MSCAIFAAVCGVMDGSKAFTFDAMVTAGMGGRIQTWAVAATGARSPEVGKAVPAVLDTQPPMAGPLPTVSVTAGGEPPASPEAGCGPCVDRSAATGTQPTKNMAATKPTGSRQPR